STPTVREPPPVAARSVPERRDPRVQDAAESTDCCAAAASHVAGRLPSAGAGRSPRPCGPRRLHRAYRTARNKGPAPDPVSPFRHATLRGPPAKARSPPDGPDHKAPRGDGTTIVAVELRGCRSIPDDAESRRRPSDVGPSATPSIADRHRFHPHLENI